MAKVSVILVIRIGLSFAFALDVQLDMRCTYLDTLRNMVSYINVYDIRRAGCG